MVEEYEKWGLNINLKKTNYMTIRTDSKDLILEVNYSVDKFLSLSFSWLRLYVCNVKIPRFKVLIYGVNHKYSYRDLRLIALCDENITITGNKKIPLERQFFKLQQWNKSKQCRTYVISQNGVDYATANYSCCMGNNVC